MCGKELIDWVKALIYTIQWRKLKKWIWSQLVEMEDVWVLKYQVVGAHFFFQTLIASEISSRDLHLSKLIFNCANFRFSPVFEINVCKRKWFNWQKSLRALSFGYWAKSLHVSFRCAFQCYRSTAFFSFNTWGFSTLDIPRASCHKCPMILSKCIKLWIQDHDLVSDWYLN